MRKTLIIVFLFALCYSGYAQSHDYVMDRINAVKLNAECIYGYCMQSKDSLSACESAMEDLVPRLNEFLKKQDFRFIRDREHCPDSSFHVIVFMRAPDYWRSLAYVEIQSLNEIELQEQASYEAQGVQTSIDTLKHRLANVATLEELEKLISESDIAGRIQTCQVTLDTEQKLIDGGYLVYYERTTGKILEVRTPRDIQRQRYNARTGNPADRRVAPSNHIRLVFIDEPLTSKTR